MAGVSFYEAEPLSRGTGATSTGPPTPERTEGTMPNQVATEPTAINYADTLEYQLNLGAVEKPDTTLPDSHYRLCYRRAHNDWRVRDERKPFTDPEALIFVAGYLGDLNGDWQDGGSHIFHNGPIYIDKDNVAHFIDPDLEKG